MQKTSSFNNNFCNNCANAGHNYQSCKYPITSIGLIAFRYFNSEMQYLMIQRKDSLGFVEFMRGKYPIHNIEYIQNIFNEMTVSEKERIRTKSFDDLWNELWGKWIGTNYRGEERISREKHKSLKDGIMNKNIMYDVDYFINNSNTSWVDAEWGFPKGRRNFQEKDLNCAMREFEEETGISKMDVKLALNMVPYEEVFTGSNLKSYKHKYFLMYMDYNTSLKKGQFEKSEVSKMEWATYEQGISVIRDYNIERKRILNKIHHTIIENIII